MRQSIVPWCAAAAILILGVAGSLAVPSRLKEPARHGVVRAALQIVERGSPIVGAGGVLVENLGIETAGGASMTLIPKGSSTPALGTLSFTTPTPEQPDILIHLVRGLSERAAEDRSLGWFRIGPLPSAPQGGARALVFFRVDEGAIGLAALEPASRMSLPVGPSGPPQER
ncbi:MAG TPA: Hsp70 family protein [Candidatus Polarisedimenticolia bacterium]|nr:Hsp70 family protein [Candidatus Polarisedimenticolia bacterium]